MPTRGKARKTGVREDIIPALGRVPSQNEYQKAFIAEMSIGVEEAEKLYQAREEGV